ncbi:MAG: DNA-deoxyinosine glycosylase [Gammaproteobacteria bacterium]|nr:DNA-deoxyinosine glycosylase [Gammaproteobacteria bacterium]
METGLGVRTAFPPIVGDDARILILGSMPGEASLRQQQYYGHPRNAFWPILCELLGIAPSSSYAERSAALMEHGIALWDVIAACERPGSLDQSIRAQTVRVNDFAAFFSACPAIRRIVFNGGTAEREYERRVLAALPPRHQAIPRYRFPSTSPANASLRFEQKLSAWRRIMDWLEP